MAKDELTGNMATENVYAYFDEINVDTALDREAFNGAMSMVNEVFMGRD